MVIMAAVRATQSYRSTAQRTLLVGLEQLQNSAKRGAPGIPPTDKKRPRALRRCVS